nr:DUF1134 domain-containing protein [Aurantiacibacter spongiae]
MCLASLGLPLLVAMTVPATAQIQSVDPDTAIDGDLMDDTDDSAARGSGDYAFDGAYETTRADSRYDEAQPVTSADDRPASDLPPAAAGGTYDSDEAVEAVAVEQAHNPSDTYAEDDLIGAAEGLFGRGAEGLARLIQDILSDQGEPNGYIVGREGGGAFILGVRYGSGTLFHKVEGNMPVYWTGPSIGLDAGANAGNTFVLVYNLHDTDELYERFPAGEGQAYFVGGFNASYVRKGDIVLIPIRVGAGLRLGINAGYMKFSRKQRWSPF